MGTLKYRAGANREHLATIGAFVVATNAIALRCPNMLVTTMGADCLAINPTNFLKIPTRLELCGEGFHELHIWHCGVLDGKKWFLDFSWHSFNFLLTHYTYSIPHNRPKVKGVVAKSQIIAGFSSG